MELADRGSKVVHYVRFQSPHRNRRGYFTGIFGLINTLARAGKLTAEQTTAATTLRTPTLDRRSHRLRPRDQPRLRSMVQAHCHASA